MAYNILIVDDSGVTRAVLKRTIEMTQVPVENFYEAANGVQGLEKLETESVDLIMTDINMPEMNGMEMAAAILGNPNTTNIPIVIISTHAEDTRIQELKSQGIKAYIHKPFTPEGIREVLDNVLDLNEAQA